MKELQCPSCGHMNPDIRELGYTLPWGCFRCGHIWRLQDVEPVAEPMTKEEALAFLVKAGISTPDGRLAPEYGGELEPKQ